MPGVDSNPYLCIHSAQRCPTVFMVNIQKFAAHRHWPWLLAVGLAGLVYADTPAALHPLAARSVQAHLVKLTREGKVQQSGGRLQLADVA